MLSEGITDKGVLDRCGDGRLTEPEQCDDANPWSGDGCSNQCTVEVGFKCTYNFNPEFNFVDEVRSHQF